MNYAIVENGIVKNVIWMAPGTAFPGAVPCGDIPAGIGDSFDGERFYRGGKKVLTELEAMEERHDEEIAALIEEVYMGDLEVIG